MLNLTLAELYRLESVACEAKGLAPPKSGFVKQPNGGFWRDPWRIDPAIGSHGDTRWIFSFVERSRDPYANFSCFRDAALFLLAHDGDFSSPQGLAALAADRSIDLGDVNAPTVVFESTEVKTTEPWHLHSTSVVVAATMTDRSKGFASPRWLPEWSVGPLPRTTYTEFYSIPYGLFAVDILEQLYSANSTPFD
jgi:hypothetical protein